MARLVVVLCCMLTFWLGGVGAIRQMDDVSLLANETQENKTRRDPPCSCTDGAVEGGRRCRALCYCRLRSYGGWELKGMFCQGSD
mmetsp:Transcript_71393/g.126116  ORF Transcript_71393/g.126116 Transcript_71393/m.126116 type:complete len:85 (+) Transcript_71393:61-315(+)|eukprot:CAMPEP_0197622944 /NCGR_PEP_ID=MMETSP1338-20131121/3052_1 /TAXON_ID=43686 ORGANISM="Pelagodinium beii, Strain RCC1491" /NCGR_SAMPLE_ID=MMETSP1338 /ASSEMBLY_ACC=CAM_ASM_000754 /LENGTH=84 /DNA_ID=CAMNT_0043192747 /DNA_START=61 /DNA_END=315 /DNA_ORIENTATION=-